MSLTVFWFRRDLRLHDNAGLYEALKNSGNKVQPLFIFDPDILKRFKNKNDTRVQFIHNTLKDLKSQLQSHGSDLWVHYGKPQDVFSELISKHKIQSLYANHDYEPQAIERDQRIRKLCETKNVGFHTFKDQVVFEKEEVLSGALKPYTVYTPYKKKWLASVSPFYLKTYPTEKYFSQLQACRKFAPVPALEEIGFAPFPFNHYPQAKLSHALLKKYAEQRDFPALDATSHLGLHLRFGTLSVRELVREAQSASAVWLSELVWREFFMQILFHFPHVTKGSFRPEYDKVEWRANASELERWKNGETGYPLVDAGQRELLATGYMHNRLRMVSASFFTKHLLMYWMEGEKHFADYLLDYELASNNGNWQWAAGTGCDAAPYFRVFNPETQLKKFDPDLKYVKKWVPEFGSSRYPQPMVDHAQARERALRAFHKALKGKPS